MSRDVAAETAAHPVGSGPQSSSLPGSVGTGEERLGGQPGGLSLLPAGCSPRAALLRGLTLGCAQRLGRVRLFATPWTVARQAPLPMRILQTRTLEWAALPSSRGSSQPRDPPRSPASKADSLPSEPPGEPGSHSMGLI